MPRTLITYETGKPPIDHLEVRIAALRLALHRIANHKDTLRVKIAIAELALRADDTADQEMGKA